MKALLKSGFTWGDRVVACAGTVVSWEPLDKLTIRLTIEGTSYRVNRRWFERSAILEADLPGNPS
jgi:hypothetical protein